MRTGVFSMSTIWVICGAGRHVGKTTLARSLCEVLPSSIYAKCGHGKRKPGQLGHFFQDMEELRSFIEAAGRSLDHVVVESNALALERGGDITIFLDAANGRTDLRPDRADLRGAADLVLSADRSSRKWRTFLRSRLSRTPLCEQVLNTLKRQQRYLFGSGAAGPSWDSVEVSSCRR